MATAAHSSPLFECRNLVGGVWRSSNSGKVLTRENPADTREIVSHYQDSTPDDAAAAADAAAQAFPAWARVGGPARGEYLRKAADILESRLEDVAVTMTREMGKTIGEARGETRRGVTILRYYAQEGLRELGLTIPSSDPRTLMYTTRVPLGPVALITPWNFPIAIPLWKMAPALIYGNTVVLKPASLTTGTAVKIIECLVDAGIPSGVVNLVSGSGSRVGRALIEDPHIHAISFTGSNEVGRDLASRAVQHGTKYQLEMGGKNPVVVCDDADLGQAVELTTSGAMRSTGQKCTATSRAIVLEPILEEFTDRVVARCRSLSVGPGLDESVYMGPAVSQAQLTTDLDYIALGQREGARLLCGGKRLEEGDLAHGYFVAPTVFDRVTPHMRIAQEEIFGPLLGIISVRTLEEALEVANGIRFGLSASIFTRDIDRALAFATGIEAGMVRINGETAGVEPQAPFGGMKASSSHSREQGRAALEFFTTVKTIAVSPTAY
ncbi:MAG: aldehyde dehydrogenase family protein [Chloroflexi bacterium]|nr:aldehyde dehydrogenase family protein [Chloroflexota bacterium]